MQLTIRITCDSPPFEDDPIGEIDWRVLRAACLQAQEKIATLPIAARMASFSIPAATRSETSC